jgi:RHS repeat-associated protein
VDNVSNETVSYTYDTLNRLTAAAASGKAWSQTYTYDGFGNLTGKSAVGAYPALNLTYNPATNSAGGNDANGNPTGVGYTFDVENRMITGAGNGYAYDPAGKRVKKAYGNAWEFYFYGVGGQKLVTLACVMGDNGLGCPGGNQYNVYFGGKLVKSKGLVVAADRLGSVRANSNGERMSYYPYGEERTSTADDREKFGTYTRDNPYQDYADQRYYAPWGGRFLTADPYVASGGPGVPATWNRYAYVHGDPVNFYDRRGRNEFNADGYCPPEYETCNYDPEGGGGGDGGGGGGVCGADSGMGFVPVPDPACYAPGPPPPPPAPTPDCEEQLVDTIQSFLGQKMSSLAAYAGTMEAVAASDNIDPRLFAAIAVSENGSATNNPFGLGPNGSNTYSSMTAAISALGQALDKYIYRWSETSVSALWSGNGWIVDPKKKWITIQPPAYCVGSTDAEKAGCLSTGNTISIRMKSMSGNPNNLGFPCPD